MLYAQRYEALRKVLRDTRRKAGLTQVGLAQKLGKGQSYVSKIERGEQYLDVLEFILWCEACGTPSGRVIAKV
ncbi:helix-turn-helix domain-containing protein [Paraburkholderia sp.]|uniref:helix-turn-helix domain-containing protein n=1 Tax=Paraburkholderia sp. TaxID=1926495 RepID=UPI0025D6736A|nr:helix-turn-helix transcriptional regulator [Paraburkholderia sp.]